MWRNVEFASFGLHDDDVRFGIVDLSFGGFIEQKLFLFLK